MPNPIFLEPIDGEDPCGPDLQWDADFLQLQQDLEQAKIKLDPEAFVDGELADSQERTASFENILDASEALLKKTKDIRVAVIYAEAAWLDGGLSLFAQAVEDMVTMVEAWPEAATGVHPRADTEDEKDLGERAAAMGKLLHQIPQHVVKVGWGEKQPEISERQAAAVILKGVFDSWTPRLEPSFGMDLPSAIEAWKTLQGLTKEEGLQEDNQADGEQQPSGSMPASGDAWNVIERAAELMAQQDRHSPALPMLRLLSTWRGLGIIDIATTMKVSGVSLEQLLESIRKQTEGG